MERFYKKVKAKLIAIITMITSALLFANGMMFYSWLETLTDVKTATIWGNGIIGFLLLSIMISMIFILRSKENGEK